MANNGTSENSQAKLTIARIVPSLEAGVLKAHFDIDIQLGGNVITICGMKLLKTEGKDFFIGFPARKGKKDNTWFDSVKVDQVLARKIKEAAMLAYAEDKALGVRQEKQRQEAETQF